MPGTVIGIEMKKIKVTQSCKMFGKAGESQIMEAFPYQAVDAMNI